MIAVASTLVEGARLEKILQHDKLGLDKEMEDVDGEVSEGRMVEIGTIRDILDRVAQDETVMERVRKRARALLAKAGY
jgi:hypothetical protein